MDEIAVCIEIDGPGGVSGADDGGLESILRTSHRLSEGRRGGVQEYGEKGKPKARRPHELRALQMICAPESPHRRYKA